MIQFSLCFSFLLVTGGVVQDALVVSPTHAANGVQSLSQLPAGAVIGTSALRRAAVLGATHPTLITKDIRGNVNTRLKKLVRLITFVC
jgi:porphobilinogen deaminase